MFPQTPIASKIYVLLCFSVFFSVNLARIDPRTGNIIAESNILDDILARMIKTPSTEPPLQAESLRNELTEGVEKAIKETLDRAFGKDSKNRALIGNGFGHDLEVDVVGQTKIEEFLKNFWNIGDWPQNLKDAVGIDSEDKINLIKLVTDPTSAKDFLTAFKDFLKGHESIAATDKDSATDDQKQAVLEFVSNFFSSRNVNLTRLETGFERRESVANKI